MGKGGREEFVAGERCHATQSLDAAQPLWRRSPRWEERIRMEKEVLVGGGAELMSTTEPLLFENEPLPSRWTFSVITSHTDTGTRYRSGSWDTRQALLGVWGFWPF